MKKTVNFKRVIALILAFMTILTASAFAETQEAKTASAGGSNSAFEIAKGFGVIGEESENSVFTAEMLANAYKAITGVESDDAFVNADVEAVSKMFVTLLGTDVRKTASNTYRSVLSSLGGFKGVDTAEDLSVLSFAKIFKNVLELNMTELVINGKGNSYEKSDETFVNYYFKASKYAITVTSALQQEIYVKATVNKISDKENLGNYTSGESVSLTYGNNSILANYKNVEVIAFINSDGEILYWYPASDSYILYASVEAVNGSENETRSYYGKYINTLELEGDKYSVAKNTQITYDGKNALTSSHKYIGRFAKAVVSGGKITKLDVYNLSEGGIFKAYDSNTISITKGMGMVKKLKDLDKLDNINVVIDGQPKTLESLTEGVLLDYYMSDNELLLVGSSYKITDYFGEMSDKYIKLSSSKYELSREFSVYFSNSSGEFLGTSNAFNILNSYCDVWFDYKGFVRYVRLNPDVTEKLDGEYYGLLTGIELDSNDPFGDNGYNLKFFKLQNGKCDEVIVKTTDDIELPDTLSNIKSTLNIRTSMDKNIYVLKDNSEGLVMSMENANTAREVFVSDNNTHLTFSKTRLNAYDGGESLFSSWNSDREDAYAITIVDGKTKCVPFVSGNVTGVRYGYISTCYVVPEMGSKADLALCWNSKYDDGILYTYEASQGLVTDVSVGYDSEKDEQVNCYSILQTDGTILELNAPLGTEFDVLEKGMLFSYKSYAFFGEYPIYLGPTSGDFGRDTSKMLKIKINDSSIYNNALDYTDFIDGKIASGTEIKNISPVTNKTQLYKDTVYIYGDKRIWFGAKNLYGVNTISDLPVFKVNLATGDFEQADDSEIYEGREIYFYFNGDFNVDFVFVLE